MKELEIDGLDIYPVREPVSGRAWTLVRIRAQGGLKGWGECRADVPARDVEAARRTLAGRQATAREAVAPMLPASLRPAVNSALLDIAGKYAKAPVYQLLGGPTRHKVRVMAPAAGESLQALREAGYRAFAVPAPAGSAHNQGQAFVLAARKELERLRGSAGDSCDFVLDAGGRLSASDAQNLAVALESFHLLWFDEPVALPNLAAAKNLARASVTPLGFGRTADSAAEFQDLLREDAVDVIRPDISRAGIGGIRRMAALAEAYYFAVAPYLDGGPVAEAAALQLAASLPNFFIQQLPSVSGEDARLREAIAPGWRRQIRDGFAALPVKPGLGIEIDEAALGRRRTV